MLFLFVGPSEKQEQREEHHQDGHRHYESPAALIACIHLGGLDAVNTSRFVEGSKNRVLDAQRGALEGRC